MKNKAILGFAGLAVLAGCATYVAPTKEESMQTVKASFKERGPAKLDRLNQTEIQAVCSDAQMTGKEVPKAQREALEKKTLATIKFPADGKYLGDFKEGERIAQSGVYGKLRGNSEAVVKYTWGKIWNTHAYNLCSQMPRYGDAGILTEAQIKDVMALLLDPNSPVNK
ncbi:MAG: soxX [Burkholderiaceae bacterium]|nr:soxX [Burkholderiaceae bacterium]